MIFTKKAVVILWCLLTAMYFSTGCRRPSGVSAYQDGVTALSKGDYLLSIELLTRAIEKIRDDRKKAAACNYLGIAYARTGQKGKAVIAFRKSTELCVSLPDPLYNSGVLLMGEGKEKKAVDCFEKASVVDRREIKALEYLGCIYRRRCEWNEARRVLNEAHNRMPSSSRVLTQMALLELQTNNVENAVSFLHQALEHDPDYPPAVFNLAMVHNSSLHDLNEARSYFKQYLRLPSDGTHKNQALKALRKIALSQPADVKPGEKEKHDIKSAEQSKKRDKERKPDRTKAEATVLKQPSVGEMLENAEKLSLTGRREAAVNWYLKAARQTETKKNVSIQKRAVKQAVKLCEENPRSHYEVGLYFSERKQKEKAVIHFKQAVIFSTNWFEPRIALAKAALDVKEFDVARISVKQAAKIQPDNPNAVWILAQFCQRNKHLVDLGAKYYSQFIELFPNDSRVREAKEQLKKLKLKTSL